MIKIALRKLAYFDQIFFNANNSLWKLVLIFTGSYYVKSYRTQALNIDRLDPNQDVS